MLYILAMLQLFVNIHFLSCELFLMHFVHNVWDMINGWDMICVYIAEWTEECLKYTEPRQCGGITCDVVDCHTTERVENEIAGTAKIALRYAPSDLWNAISPPSLHCVISLSVGSLTDTRERTYINTDDYNRDVISTVWLKFNWILKTKNFIQTYFQLWIL